MKINGNRWKKQEIEGNKWKQMNIDENVNRW